jgi:uncharacterized protein
MTAASLALLGFTVVLSSFISGVFGMAGGMILLGMLLVYFDVATAMVMFSILQIAGNGWRAMHWRRFARWPIVLWYIVGSLLAFLVMRAIAYVPNKAVVYILLGSMPFLTEAVPQALRPNIEWRGVPLATGFLTTVVQFMAGVGGLFLDIFFQKSMLDRRTTNATKGAAQSLSHVVRIVYFTALAGTGGVPWLGVPPAIVLAIAATSAAPFVIERMTDHGFRKWTRVIIFAVSIVYLYRGAMLFWRG